MEFKTSQVLCIIFFLHRIASCFYKSAFNVILFSEMAVLQHLILHLPGKGCHLKNWARFFSGRSNEKKGNDEDLNLFLDCALLFKFDRLFLHILVAWCQTNLSRLYILLYYITLFSLLLENRFNTPKNSKKILHLPLVSLCPALSGLTILKIYIKSLQDNFCSKTLLLN